MRKSSESSDILNSDADGSYDISFFASSIGHTIGLSRSVFAKFSAAKFSDAAQHWKAATSEEQKAYLLEHHEAAHHGLLFSTPAGVLLWRLNQVLARDVHYISKTLKEFGMVVPLNRIPSTWLNSPEFGEALERQEFAHPGHKLYLLEIIDAVERVRLFRKLFFEKNAARNYPSLTIGELLALCQFVYPYLAKRCCMHSRVTWTTRLDPETKVFPPGKAFNVVDIAECHAIAKELFILRAVGDRIGFDARLADAIRGQFGPCITQSIEIAKYANEIGFSPHGIQMAAVIACSAKIDISQSEVVQLCLEEQLPWWKYTESVFSAEATLQSIESLHSQSTRPLIGAGSKWIVFYPRETGESSGSAYRFSHYLQTLASFGLDLQIYLIHQGLKENLTFLTETVKHTLNHRDTPVPESVFNTWNAFLFLNQAFIEYSDGLFHRELDIATIYKEDHPLRRQLSDLVSLPAMQLLAHILNGAFTRRAIAVYTRSTIPRSEVIANKLYEFVREYLEDFPQEGQRFADTLSLLINEVLAKGRDLPFGLEHLWEQTRERFI
jgi:hypothetical protein